MKYSTKILSIALAATMAFGSASVMAKGHGNMNPGHNMQKGIMQHEQTDKRGGINDRDSMNRGMMLGVNFGNRFGNKAQGNNNTKIPMTGDAEKDIASLVTEEERKAMLEELQAVIDEKIADMKENLADKLEDGEISEDKYNQMISYIESGRLMLGEGGMRGRAPMMQNRAEKEKKQEMTEEEKAEKLSKMKEELAAKLENGEITQEDYDKIIEAVESGKMRAGNRHPNGRMDKAPKADSEVTEPEAPSTDDVAKEEVAEETAEETTETVQEDTTLEEQVEIDVVI